LGFYVPLPGVDGKAFSAYMVEGSSAGFGELIGFLNKLAAGQRQDARALRVGHPSVHFFVDHLFASFRRCFLRSKRWRRKARRGSARSIEYSRRRRPFLSRSFRGWSSARNFLDQLQVNGVALIPSFGLGFHSSVEPWRSPLEPCSSMWVGEQITEYGIGNGWSLADRHRHR
jgi:hypothetical protein